MNICIFIIYFNILMFIINIGLYTTIMRAHTHRKRGIYICILYRNNILFIYIFSIIMILNLNKNKIAYMIIAYMISMYIMIYKIIKFF